MTTPLVGKAFATLLLCSLAASPAAANSAAGAGRVAAGPSGPGFSGLSPAAQLDFARSLGLIATQASLLNSPGLSGFAPAPGLLPAPAAAPARASADQVLSFLATSPGETETEFKARRAVLGALWREDQAFADGLVAALRGVDAPEAREAADALARLARDYRPLVRSQRARIARDIPALSRLQALGSFDEVGALFDRSLRRGGEAVREDGGAVEASGGRLAPSSREALSGRLSKADPAALAAAKAEPAVAAALPAPAPASAETRGMAGVMGKAKGVLREHKTQIGGYIGMVGLAAPSLGGILMMGDGMSAPGAGLSAAAAIAAGHAALGPLGLLLLQAFVILAVAKLMGVLLAKIGQPSVIGQVLGGLLLGPSALGALFPGMMGSLFPSASLAFLDPLSQFGLIFFMFIVGLELDTKLLRKQGGAAGLVSHASILFPFVLGAGLALLLFTGFAPAGIPFHVFALFMGISMSITAFPVLASILKEKKLLKTPLGSLALTSAAVDDATAWPLLAFVVAIAASGSGAGALPMLGLTAGYVAFMLLGVRPLLARWVNKLMPEQAREPGSAVVPILVTILSALATEMIGIHALFGAFLAGVIIPRGSELRHQMEKWLGNFSGLILLPIFFAMTGLRTELSLLGGPFELAVTAGIILVATLGKLGGAAAAARWSGLGWRDSLSIGALMNTRGLMELIVLNIGYSMGILSPTLFAMLVVMAVFTTFITTPLLQLINRGRSKAASAMLQEARS